MLSIINIIKEIYTKKEIMFKKSSALFLFTFLIFSACNQNTAEDVHDEIVDKVNEESAGSLVIYSGRQESLVSELINSFSAETGVVVEVRYAKSSSLAGTLSLEGAMSPADVFLSQDPLSLSIVANEDLFEILPQNILKLVYSIYYYQFKENLKISFALTNKLFIFNIRIDFFIMEQLNNLISLFA